MIDDIPFEIRHRSLRELLTYTTVGVTHTFSKADYPWLKYVRVRLVGGGGGSGGITTPNVVQSITSGGGGGGGYAESLLHVSDLAASIDITIGDGGAGGAAGVNNGSAGGDTTFIGSPGPTVTAKGGGGGVGGNDSGNAWRGGEGGDPANGVGDILLPGSDGFAGWSQSTVSGAYSYGGGSGAFYGGMTGRGNTNNAVAGKLYGGGAKGPWGRDASAAGAKGGAGIAILELYG